MRYVKINDNWKFWNEGDAFAMVWSVPDNARNITLPHDAMIEKAANPNSLNGGNTGFRDGGSYNYARFLNVKDLNGAKVVYIKFEGVYMNSFVYVNGELAGHNPNGYTEFFVRIDHLLREDIDNEIRVVVKNAAMPNSRWYSGSGIYRDVYLVTGNEICFAPEGIQIQTGMDGNMLLSSEIINLHVSGEEKQIYFENTIVDKNGKELVTKKELAGIVSVGDERIKVSGKMYIDNPELWSAENPLLYSCISRLTCDDEVLDEVVSKFGFRDIKLVKGEGFFVNGKSVKLRGACIHNDNGIIGACEYRDVAYRRVQLLKEAGFNAIRSAHNPMSIALLDACDELGMYVCDEAFDMWTRAKGTYDYSMFFNEWWQKDLAAMINKDYNHPSVVMYSVGNEISEISTATGRKIYSALSNEAKRLDSSRLVVTGINGAFLIGDNVEEIIMEVAAEMDPSEFEGENVNVFLAVIDKKLDVIINHDLVSAEIDKIAELSEICGYNYMEARYANDLEKYPERMIIGTESYPPAIAKVWKETLSSKNVIGDFTWTGWDYIGETGIGIVGYKPGEGGLGAQYPCQLGYCGDIDITGFRRPASYLREIVYGIRKDPYIAVMNPDNYGRKAYASPWAMSDVISSWSFKGQEGKTTSVEVYSPSEAVELFINGVSVGRKPAGKENDYKAIFEVVYEPGVIKAVGSGSIEGSFEIKSSGQEKNVEITKEEKSELIFVNFRLVDEEGNTVTDSDREITFEAESEKLLAFGSSDPRPVYNYKETADVTGNTTVYKTNTYNGRALAILRK